MTGVHGYTYFIMAVKHYLSAYFKIQFILILSFLVTACAQPADRPTLNNIHQTPQVDPAEFPVGLLQDPEVDEVTAHTLETFPLFVGSTWIYGYMGFDQNLEVFWRVSDTVVETKLMDGFYIARVDRAVELLEGAPPPDFLAVPEAATFFYLVDGENVYLAESVTDSELPTTWLDLVIPFPPAGELWYTDRNQRVEPEQHESGIRQVSQPFQESLPTGEMHTCVTLQTQLPNGSLREVFCETVGYAFRAFNFDEIISGYRVELVGYSLQQ